MIKKEKHVDSVSNVEYTVDKTTSPESDCVFCNGDLMTESKMVILNEGKPYGKCHWECLVSVVQFCKEFEVPPMNSDVDVHYHTE